MNKPWQPYARHILDAIAQIRRIGQRGDITGNSVLYDATLRHPQTLAQATQCLPETIKAGHPQIPWRQISGLRNILVHNYLGDIDPVTIARIVDEHLHTLEVRIRHMLAGDVTPPS